jgi:hypothetical protein
MGYYVHDTLNEVVFYNTLNWTFKNELILYDLKLSSFFKMEHRICTKYADFYKFIFIKKLLRKNCDLLGNF